MIKRKNSLVFFFLVVSILLNIYFLYLYNYKFTYVYPFDIGDGKINLSVTGNNTCGYDVTFFHIKNNSIVFTQRLDYVKSLDDFINKYGVIYSDVDGLIVGKQKIIFPWGTWKKNDDIIGYSKGTKDFLSILRDENDDGLPEKQDFYAIKIINVDENCYNVSPNTRMLKADINDDGIFDILMEDHDIWHSKNFSFLGDTVVLPKDVFRELSEEKQIAVIKEFVHRKKSKKHLPLLIEALKLEKTKFYAVIAILKNKYYDLDPGLFIDYVDTVIDTISSQVNPEYSTTDIVKLLEDFYLFVELQESTLVSEEDVVAGIATKPLTEKTKKVIQLLKD